MIDHQKDFARGLLKKIMKINLHFHKLSLILAIVLGFISLTSYSKSVLADSSSQPTHAELIQVKSSEDENHKNIDFSGTGRPNDQTAAGSRDSCEGMNEKELTALVPKNNGLTISEYPTLWIYIPNESKNVRYSELVLQNEKEGTEIARIPYELQETPGIVSVTIPPKPEYSLKTNTIDRWYFTVICNNRKRYSVGGFIQGVTLDFAEHNAEHNYDSYLNNGIWYDALTDLAERLRLDPEDLKLRKDWTDLMNAKGVGLEQLAEEFKFGSVVPTN